MMSEETVKIPEGHSVRVHSVAAEPSLLPTESGVLLVHLGFPGDDPKEITSLVQQVNERTQRPMQHALFLEEPAKLSDLFAPKQVKAHQHAVVVWTMPGDAFSVEWLSSAIESMRALRLLGIHQWLIFGGAPNTTEEALAPIKALAVPILVSSPEKHFLTEVKRPDDQIVVGMTNLTRWQAPKTSPSQNPSLFRAPLLRRLLLEASEAKSDEAWQALYQELTARRSPFLFFVEPGGGLRLMSWNKSAEYLPIFSDLRTLLQTAAALKREIGPHGIGALSAKELFSFAQKNKLRLAFSIFLEDGQVRYVIVPDAAYQALGEGRVPEVE